MQKNYAASGYGLERAAFVRGFRHAEYSPTHLGSKSTPRLAPVALARSRDESSA